MDFDRPRSSNQRILEKLVLKEADANEKSLETGKVLKMLESIWQILMIVRLIIEIAHELKKDPKE